MEGEGKYNYHTLKDACIAVDQDVNLYGVITDYSLPKSTKGKDFICTMTVADMNTNLQVNIFGSKDQLPQVRASHDIIRFHRVKIDIHGGSPRAVGNAKICSFLLFDGSSSGSNEPYHCSSATFTLETHELGILRTMRDWRLVCLAEPATSKYLVRIRDIGDKDKPSYFDLFCKVLHVSKPSSENATPTFVYVWDGTDSPETTSLPFVERPWLPLEVLRKFPVKGTVLLVVLDAPFDDTGDWLPRIESWVKLRNIGSRICEGKREAFFAQKSKICVMTTEYLNVQEAEKHYAHRLASAEEGLPENCPKPVVSLTFTDYDHVPYSTLREVLASQQVTYKFRCLVRVKSTAPSNVVDFCTSVDGEYIYQLKLTLEDPTAQIEAYLYAEDGEMFFNGFPAAPRDPGDACLDAFQRSFSRLLGDGVNPPYISCCIKSYYLHKEQPWTSRRFRIFGTRLLS